MATTDFPLSLTLKAVDKASSVFKHVGEQIEKISEPAHHVKEAFGEVRKEIAITGLEFYELFEAGHKAFEFFKSGIEAGSQLKEAADRAGFAVDAYAQLRFAALQAGVKQEEFAAATDHLNKVLGEAQHGSGPLMELLQKVSPRYANLIKHAKDAPAAFEILNEAFRKLGKDGPKKAALQQAAFGRSSKQMSELLSESAEELKKHADRYAQLAGSQKDFAEGSKEADDAFNETGAALEGLRSAAFTPLLPVLTEVAHAFADLVAGNKGKLKEWAEGAGKAIDAWVKGGGLERLSEGTKEFAKSLANAIDMIGGFKGALFGLGAVALLPTIASLGSLTLSLAKLAPAVNAITFGPLIAAAGNFVTGIRAGYGVLEALNLSMVGGAAAAAPFILAAAGIGAAGYEIYKNWQPIKETFEAVWTAWSKIATTGTGFGKLWHAVTGEYDAAPAFQGLPASSMRADVSGAVPPAGGGQSRVQVDFVNLPTGVRVKQDSSNSGDFLDMTLGYTNWLPQ